MNRVGAVIFVCAACGRVSFDARGPDAATSSSYDAPELDGPQSVCASPRLVAHWTFDETNGSVIADVAGAYDGVWVDGNDDVVTGESAASPRGRALTFTTNCAVAIPSFTMPAEGTFAVWLTSGFDDTTAPGGNHYMVFDAPTPRTTVSYDTTIGVYGMRTNDVSYQSQFSLTADLQGWFHLAGTWSATGALLYLNGARMHAGPLVDARSTSPLGLYLGTREALDRWWDGRIDDVRIYDYALGEAEIAALYACP